MRIIAVGDIMPGGVLNKTSVDYLSPEVLNLLKDADLRVGTLETAIGNEPTFNEQKMRRKADVIYVRDEDLLRLKTLNINIVSLANNHFTDLGDTGSRHAIELLDELGILHCGAGENIEEASRPVVINSNGKTYAFLAFCDWRDETVGWCPIATKNDAGVNPMYDDYVVKEIKKNKQIYDYVIVIAHWGKEYRIAPTPDVYKLSKKMVNAGADLILGGHTHCIQPIWKYKSVPIIFSLGNFFFPDRLLTYPRSTYYPDEPTDLEKLPKTEGYPRYVERVTYKIWKPIARYGLVAQIGFSNDVTYVNSFFSHLTYKNYLELARKEPYNKKRMKILKIALNSGLYEGFYFLGQFFNSFRNQLFKLYHIK